MHMPQKHLQKNKQVQHMNDKIHKRFQVSTRQHKTPQFPTLINEPTLKTIKSFLGVAHFIIWYSITNVR
jgi:hypothetical protein